MENSTLIYIRLFATKVDYGNMKKKQKDRNTMYKDRQREI